MACHSHSQHQLTLQQGRFQHVCSSIQGMQLNFHMTRCSSGQGSINTFSLLALVRELLAPILNAVNACRRQYHKVAAKYAWRACSHLLISHNEEVPEIVPLPSCRHLEKFDPFTRSKYL